MKISFIPTLIDPSLPQPIPAVKGVPEWYRLTPRFIDGKKAINDTNDGTTGTIKTCMPVLDSLTAGYLILSSADLFISKKEGGNYYSWANHGLIEFHSQRQLPFYPKLQEKINNDSVPKFSNPWIIKTPKNYSCLFVTPMHHDLPFTILPGIVDTDSYVERINFPFIPNSNFEGLIPRGTPIAQVIPFCRESWSMSIDSMTESKKLKKEILYIKGLRDSTYFDRYKKNWWNKKEYK
jgi:hypothetical protein